MSQLRDRTTWLQGDMFSCLQPAPGGTRQWRLILLGPPGVGKGTQSRLLADALGACPLSTADIFRTQLEHSRSLSLERIRERIDHGLLVPDDFVLSIIRERRNCLRCRGGFLLDGFPRTVVQAASLDALLVAEHVRIDAVIHYHLPVADLIARMSGRRVCPRCHAVYHAEHRPPRVPGACNHCAERLVHLADDKPAAIQSRLTTYVEATEQVAVHYHRQGLVVPISAAEDATTVFEQTLLRLAERGLPVPALAASGPAPVTRA